MSDQSIKSLQFVEDPLLQYLVGLADEQQMEIGITLQVSGMLVSGMLVSLDAYMARFNEQFGGALAKSNPDIGEGYRQGAAERRLGEDSGEPSTENPALPTALFAHMKDARFFDAAGNAIPLQEGALWRGRISEVSGFFLGVLSQ